MNNPLVDEIQALADCRSHAARADWLLTVPLSVLSHYEMTIRNRLQIAGFHEGVDYLERELKAVRRPRRAGRIVYDEAWAEAAHRMQAVAFAPDRLPDLEAGPASAVIDAPDHGLTDL